MFIVSLTYQVPLNEVDKFIPEHIEYLNVQYEKGHFILSGRKEPRLCENSFAFLRCKKSSKKISNAIFFLRSIIFCARAKLLIL
ncbi:hypothetical protein AN214_00076 [Pseudoalteromonas sp. P1-9]|uniref:YciI family protein n=1 Tax=Pseudoalteromonas sp. P1-9 TaxID=1710354 RepID=UPI000707A35E|nr:YciI family protein [Pseudoalteromonas sp. P1-9]KPV98315.1 hypothetical protein AN214_00076 [Pseudoalteromonas sp. P1-9]